MKLPGARELRKDEPAKEVSHHFFMMEEMKDMALDVQSESDEKRKKLALLAYEAKAFVLRKHINASKRKETVIESPFKKGTKEKTATDEPMLNKDITEPAPVAEPIMPPIGDSQGNDLFGDDPLAFPQPIPRDNFMADDFDNDFPGPSMPPTIGPLPSCPGNLTPLGMSMQQSQDPGLKRQPSYGPTGLSEKSPSLRKDKPVDSGAVNYIEGLFSDQNPPQVNNDAQINTDSAKAKIEESKNEDFDIVE